MCGCIQPMSSPMMKTMFGFWVVCAAAGVTPQVRMKAMVDVPSISFRTLFDLILMSFSSMKAFPEGSFGEHCGDHTFQVTPTGIESPVNLGKFSLAVQPNWPNESWWDLIVR